MSCSFAHVQLLDHGRLNLMENLSSPRSLFILTILTWGNNTWWHEAKRIWETEGRAWQRGVNYYFVNTPLGILFVYPTSVVLVNLSIIKCRMYGAHCKLQQSLFKCEANGLYRIQYTPFIVDTSSVKAFWLVKCHGNFWQAMSMQPFSYIWLFGVQLSSLISWWIIVVSLVSIYVTLSLTLFLCLIFKPV